MRTCPSKSWSSRRNRPVQCTTFDSNSSVLHHVPDLGSFDFFYVTESLNFFLQSKIKDTSKISIFKIDLKNTLEFKEILDNLEYYPNIAISTIGQLTNSPQENIFENSILEEMININYLYPARCIQIICDYFIKKEITDGTIIALSSIAGYRGRKKNYEYGAAKAAFSTFLSGLRNKLYNKIHVATIEPGFVDTKMTKNIKIPYFLADTPENLASKIMNVINNKKDLLYEKIITDKFSGNLKVR
jgi:short-subunit dehydrogenase